MSCKGIACILSESLIEEDLNYDSCITIPGTGRFRALDFLRRRKKFSGNSYFETIDGCIMNKWHMCNSIVSEYDIEEFG